MKLVQQTILAPPTGNCLAACVASLFDLPLWLVPNFTAHDRYERSGCGKYSMVLSEVPQWWTSLGTFARSHGWRVLQLGYVPRNAWAGQFVRGDVAIATVKSPRGEWEHCVLADLVTGEVVWDPHPQGWPEGHQLLAEDVSDFILFVALK